MAAGYVYRSRSRTVLKSDKAGYNRARHPWRAIILLPWYPWRGIRYCASGSSRSGATPPLPPPPRKRSGPQGCPRPRMGNSHVSLPPCRIKAEPMIRAATTHAERDAVDDAVQLADELFLAAQGDANGDLALLQLIPQVVQAAGEGLGQVGSLPERAQRAPPSYDRREPSRTRRTAKGRTASTSTNSGSRSRPVPSMVRIVRASRARSPGR